MPSEKDRFDGDNCFICVSPDGRRFHLYSGDTAEIQLGDMVNAISKQVRWMGHLKGSCWYSVAEHCVLVARLVKLLGGSVEEQFAGLMHDASEAYLADIAAPFKRELGGYYEKENLITERIKAKWGIENIMPDVVRRADWMMLWIEARELLVDDIEICKPWVGFAEYGPPALEMAAKYDEIMPRQWRPNYAAFQFTMLFNELQKARGAK